jgi:hypothetical protein
MFHCHYVRKTERQCILRGTRNRPVGLTGREIESNTMYRMKILLEPIGCIFQLSACMTVMSSLIPTESCQQK